MKQYPGKKKEVVADTETGGHRIPPMFFLCPVARCLHNTGMYDR